MKNSKGMRILWSALLICGLFWQQPGLVRGQEKAEPGDLYATSAVLMDGDSGRILYEKNGRQVMPMASTTKIMTCILALETGNLEDQVVVSAYAAAQPKVHLGMTRGSTYRMEDLLYSLMLESHNDSAVAIAEHIGSSLLDLPSPSERTSEQSKQAVAAFAGLMNEKARELGCQNTWYITPNGLDAVQQTEDGEEKTHSTTAAELAYIMRYCAWISPQKEKFLEITRTQSYSFSELGGKRGHSCQNHNSFLSMMEGALTGKTGFTNGAGYCYVGALERDGEKYVVALLACGWPGNKNWKWADTRKLMAYGLEHYELCRLGDVRQDSELPVLPVAEGQTDQLGAQAEVGLRVLQNQEMDERELLLAKWEQIRVDQELTGNLTAPVREGQQVGWIRYSLQGEELWTEEIVTDQDVPKIDFCWCFGKILSFFLFV